MRAEFFTLARLWEGSWRSWTFHVHRNVCETKPRLRSFNPAREWFLFKSREVRDWLVFFFRGIQKFLFEKCGYLYSGFFLCVHNVLAQKPICAFSDAQLFCVPSLMIECSCLGFFIWDVIIDSGTCKIFQTPKKETTSKYQPKKINTTTLATTISYIPFLCVLWVKLHPFLESGTISTWPVYPNLHVTGAQGSGGRVLEAACLHGCANTQTSTGEESPCEVG